MKSFAVPELLVRFQEGIETNAAQLTILSSDRSIEVGKEDDLGIALERVWERHSEGQEAVF